MPTATKTATNPQATLKTFREYGKKWAQAQEEANRLATEYAAAERKITALLDARQRLTHHHPELVDHHGKPTAKDNEVSKIDAEVAAVDKEIGGGLLELHAKLEHARKLEARAKGACEAFCRSHLDLILEAEHPAGEKARESLEAKLAELREETDRYLNHARETEGIKGLAGETSRRAVAFDVGSDLIRLLDRWHSVPNPAELS